jgi:hypothetical protein
MTRYLCVHGDRLFYCDLCEPEVAAFAAKPEQLLCDLDTHIKRVRPIDDVPTPAKPRKPRKAAPTLADQERKWIRDNGWSGK